LGAFPALRAGNRAFRLYLLPPTASKGYRFNPLRVPWWGNFTVRVHRKVEEVKEVQEARQESLHIPLTY
jgi:hypothetical protein